MVHYLTSRPALAATTSVAALLIGVAVILPVADLRIGKPTVVVETKETGPTPPMDPAADAAQPEAARTSEAAPAGGEGAALTQEIDVAKAPVVVEEDVVTDNLARSDLGSADSSAVAAEPAPGPLAEAPMADIEALPGAPVEELLTEAEPRLRAEAKMKGGEMAYLPAPSSVAPDAMPAPVDNTEAYANEAPNPVKVTAEEPVSTFSIDVDTASYAVLRSSLTGGYLPSPDQVRIEEMVNYFPYVYPAPEGDQAFASTVSVMPTPWNPGTRLVTIGIQGALPEVTARPPLNLVFLIDTSGSMDDANKLPLLKQSLSLMLSELRPEDQVSIVT